MEFKAVQPLDYYKKFVESNVRPDNRSLSEPRFTSINVGSISSADGSALVRLGNSSIICGIKAELAVPKVNSSDEGFLIPNLELSPLCAAHFRPGPPGEQAQVLSQLILEIVESSKLIDLKQLCIKKGKVAWVLYCDIICLNYDGNIIDGALISLIGALQNLKLPRVTVDPETDIPKVNLIDKKTIKIDCKPTSTTFAIFENKLLMDPTYEEETLSAGLITITVSDDGLCGVIKPGGPSIDDAQIRQCIDQAYDRRKNILELMKSTCIKDS